MVVTFSLVTLAEKTNLKVLLLHNRTQIVKKKRRKLSENRIQLSLCSTNNSTLAHTLHTTEDKFSECYHCHRSPGAKKLSDLL